MLDHLVSTIVDLASLIGDGLNLTISVLLHLVCRARALADSYLVQLLVIFACVISTALIFLFLNFLL